MKTTTTNTTTTNTTTTNTITTMSASVSAEKSASVSAQKSAQKIADLTAERTAEKIDAPAFVSNDYKLIARKYAWETVVCFRYADYETETFLDASTKLYLDEKPTESTIKDALHIRKVQSFTARKVAIVYDVNALALGKTGAVISIDAVTERDAKPET